MNFQPHTFRQYLYWLALCYRWLSSGVDIRLSWNLQPTTPQSAPTDYGTPIHAWKVLCLGHMLWHAPLIFTCALLALSKRRFSLDLHTVWRSVFDELLKSGLGSGEITTTLQHVFTCWASTVTQKRGLVKLLLWVMWWYCEWLNSIMQESSVSGE